MLGEAKSTNQVRTTSDLERLERIRALLVARGLDAGGALLVLFSRTGHAPGLVTAATRRDDVRLVDLDVLYGESRPS